MTEGYWDRLINGYLDNTLSPAEQVEFETLMLDSNAARARFWAIAEVHGLARDATRIAWSDADLIEQGSSSQPPAPTWLSHGLASVDGSPSLLATSSFWVRSGAFVIIGLAVGVLTTSLAWAMTVPRWGALHLLLAESFESDKTPAVRGVPTSPDIWSGDYTELVKGQLGIRPANGNQMLRFLRSDYEGKPNPGGYIGDVYRLIDLRSYRNDFADGGAVVQVSAHFNSVAFPIDEQYQCSVSAYALNKEQVTTGAFTADAYLTKHALATALRTNEFIDRDIATWQKVFTELRLPPQAAFLLVRVSVQHSGQNPKEGQDTYIGHFADDIRVSLARRPLMP